MSFSQDIAVEALVKCSRRCCICHKFCGTKMELHHILPKESGGEDTLDNCIPLCFDCHAEVGHYNTKHPKGKRFSSDELKLHRNSWFKKTQARDNLTQPEFLEEDKRVFILLSFDGLLDESMEYIRHQNYATGYLKQMHATLDRFAMDSLSPYKEFFCTELEEAKADLRSNISDFLDQVGAHSFPCLHHSGNGERETYSEETLIAYPDLSKEIDKMNELSETVWISYYNYVRTARLNSIAL